MGNSNLGDHPSGPSETGKSSPYSNGRFDPLTYCLEVDRNLNLSTDDEIQKAVIGNSTFFHEIVHSWQLTSFSTGLITGAIRPIQSILTKEFMPSSVCRNKGIKPLLHHFTKTVTHHKEFVTRQIEYNMDSDANSGVYMVHKYYFDFEKLFAAFEDPTFIRSKKYEDAFWGEYLPVSWNYHHGFESSLLDLMSMIHEELKVDGVNWPCKTKLIDQIKQTANPNFKSSSKWLESSLGMAAIQEGHARFLEMKLIALTDSSKASFNFFDKIGFLGNDYTKAFKLFLELSELPPPTDLLDWKVSLFIVVCEFALNPSVPYVDATDHFDLEYLLNQFHPGQRFQDACNSIAKSHSLAPKSARYDMHDYMKFAYTAIETASQPSWAPSIFDAQKQISDIAIQAMTKLSFISPLYQILIRHLRIAALKTSNDGFFFNPLTIALDGKSIIRDMLPPLVKCPNETYFFNSCVNESDRTSEEVNFFLNYVYCDLVRQWLSVNGPFVFEFPLLPQGDYRKIIIDGAKSRLKSLFGEKIFYNN